MQPAWRASLLLTPSPTAPGCIPPRGPGDGLWPYRKYIFFVQTPQDPLLSCPGICPEDPTLVLFWAHLLEPLIQCYQGNLSTHASTQPALPPGPLFQTEVGQASSL